MMHNIVRLGSSKLRKRKGVMWRKLVPPRGLRCFDIVARGVSYGRAQSRLTRNLSEDL